MRQSNLFSSAVVVAVFVAAFVTIHLRSTKEPQNDILKEKKLMQRANEIKRKGYEIDQRQDAVCGYYYWKDDLMWNIDSYCFGRHGTVKTLPDSLNFFHRRMIQEVDKIAERKGYEGW